MRPKAIVIAAAAACLLALAAPPCRAGYVIPMSAATEGGGKGTSGPYALTYTIGQASPPGTFAVAGYTLSAGLMAVLSDRQAPAIVHQSGQMAPARTAVEIQADISDLGTGVDTAVVYFREGGALTFREKPMQKGEGSTYVASLPPSSITERGLVYYLEARDHLGNRGRYPQGAPDSVLSLAIYFYDLASAFEMPSGKYRMVSLPGLPTDGDPDSVLADDFGAYDKKNWRLGRWDGGRTGCDEACYDEYPATGDFAPGKSFWLISSAARPFDMSGVTTDLSRPFAVHLARGWNQVATPFGFATDWLSTQIQFNQQTYSVGELHLVGADTIFVEDNLIAYDGAYQPFQSQLLPWAGYWIYNASTAEVDLRLDPRPPRETLAPENLAGRRAAAPGDFAINLSVRSNRSAARPALAGMGPAAQDGWDPRDLHEPPLIGDYLRVVFRHAGWGGRAGVYMSDVRAPASDGASWQFTVEASARQHASLDLATAGDIPETWQVYVYDLETGLRLDRSALPYSFEAEGSRAFALVAGTADFIASEESAANISLRPGIISVVPNPFRDNVRVTYFIPGRETVTLKIFSVEGRLVGTVAAGEAARGVHVATWDGRSLRGEPAAPGIYFMRLETAHANLVEKILRIR